MCVGHKVSASAAETSTPLLHETRIATRPKTPLSEYTAKRDVAPGLFNIQSANVAMGLRYTRYAIRLQIRRKIASKRDHRLPRHVSASLEALSETCAEELRYRKQSVFGALFFGSVTRGFWQLFLFVSRSPTTTTLPLLRFYRAKLSFPNRNIINLKLLEVVFPWSYCATRI